MPKHKNAIVYGAAGAVGGAIARSLARSGAIVHLAGRTLEALQRVAAEITEAGGTAHAAEVDALDEQAVSHHVQAVVAGAGALDISVNAIGVPHVQGPPLAELSLAEFELPLHSYLRSNFITAKNAAEVMRPAGKGVVITLSTPGSQLAGAGYLGYGVTCGAVETFTRLLAGELGPSGVRAVCLRANAIPESLPDSHVTEVFGRVAGRQGLSASDWLEAMASHHTLLGRLPTLDQVGDVASFVASDQAGAMTAAIVNLTCGTLAD